MGDGVQNDLDSQPVIPLMGDSPASGESGNTAPVQVSQSHYQEDQLRAEFGRICSLETPVRQPNEIQAKLPAFSVSQHEFAVVPYAEQGVHSLTIFGVLSCVAVSFYDAETKTGALAHFDTATLVAPSMEMIFKSFEERGIPLERLQIRLRWGIQYAENSFDLINRLETTLSERGLQRDGYDASSCDSDGDAFALNLSDGSFGVIKNFPLPKDQIPRKGNGNFEILNEKVPLAQAVPNL